MVGTDGRNNTPPRRTRIRYTSTIAAGVAALVALSACTSGGGDDKSAAPGSSGANAPAGSSGAASSSKADAKPVTVTTTATGGLRAANPAEPVTVKATDGTIKSVKLTNAAGKVVAGALADDGSSWRTTEPLGYSKTYSVVATAANSAGVQAVKRSKITTLTPDNMTKAYFNTVNGTSMENNATYGVGMIVKLHFDEPIPDKDAAEKAVKVTTSTGVKGAWYWLNDTDAHWRPKSYYAPGTKVTVKADVYGKNLGGGLYGQSDESISFNIDKVKRVTYASATTHRVKVYENNKLVKNMATSMGRGGYVTGDNGQKISLSTPDGTYTVITKENPAIMRSDSYGLPTNSPDGYGRLVVPYATKISTDGIYLHQLNDTIADQGRRNVSHGCLNLRDTDARWFFNFSRIGDPVTVTDSTGPSLEVWRGGDWTVPWSTWVKGGEK